MSSSHDITLTPQEQALIMRLKSFRVPEMAHIPKPLQETESKTF